MARDVLAQLGRIGLFVEVLQARLLLLAEHPAGQQALIGRLGRIPRAPHFVPDGCFLAQVEHWLKEIGVEIHLLIERAQGSNLLRRIQAQVTDVIVSMSRCAAYSLEQLPERL